MLITILSVSAGMAVVAAGVTVRVRARRRQQVLEAANLAGLSMDEQGNINARETYARMKRLAIDNDQAFEGRKGRFIELMRICSEGPKTIDEIRFLLAEGIEPVVRPDGLVYVPCLENRHMHMEGEIELRPVDLERFISQQEARLADGKASETEAVGRE